MENIVQGFLIHHFDFSATNNPCKSTAFTTIFIRIYLFCSDHPFMLQWYNFNFTIDICPLVSYHYLKFNMPKLKLIITLSPNNKLVSRLFPELLQMMMPCFCHLTMKFQHHFWLLLIYVKPIHPSKPASAYISSTKPFLPINICACVYVYIHIHMYNAYSVNYIFTHGERECRRERRGGNLEMSSLNFFLSYPSLPKFLSITTFFFFFIGNVSLILCQN